MMKRKLNPAAWLLAISLGLGTSLFSQLSLAQAPADLKAQAGQLYQSQRWQNAAEAYRKIVTAEPENYAAWYRLAVSEIGARRGKAAMAALQEAKKNPQIPPFLLSYQQARAHKLLGDDKKALKMLEQAADNGYSALASLTNNPFWDDVKDNKQFGSIVNKVDRTARPCAFDDKHKAFNFWLGEWDVYGNQEKTGPLFGKNRIEKQQNGCLMLEHWTGSSGSTGTSMNFYDGTKDKWVQHWVSAGGTVINIEGGLEDGSMVLTGDIFYINNAENPVRAFRGTWTPVSEGVVRQFFEESIDNGESWYPWFEGFYFKVQP